PEDGDEEVEPDAQIVITFSEEVSAFQNIGATSGPDDAFTLTCDSVDQPFTITTDLDDDDLLARFGGGEESIGTVFTLTPDNDLPFDADCTVDIASTLVTENEGTQSLDMDESFSFSVRAADPAPEVTTTSPADGDSDIAPDADITVTFSENVVADGDSFILECTQSGTVGITVNPVFNVTRVSGLETDTYSIDPNSDLQRGESCTLTIVAEEIEDTDGIAPANPDGDSFITFSVEDGLLVFFSSVQATVSEASGSYELEVELSDVVDAPATAEITLIDGDSGDLGGFTSETVSFTKVDGQLYTVTIPITEDTEAEDSESFIFQITAVDGNEPEGIGIGQPSSFALVIVDGGRGPVDGSGGPAWVNEFHYDNGGADENEFIEIAVDLESIGSVGSNNRTSARGVEDLSVVLYNGNGGVVYDTIEFEDFEEGQSIGTDNYQLYVVRPSSIQNGGPDGIALVVEDQVVQFISYEGTFEAMDGPAAGIPSVDIGVAEDGGTTANQALALQGDGDEVIDFTWAANQPASPGTVNPGQTIDGVDGSGNGGGGDPVTIAEARTQGVGSTVTINGTVTRAVGDFAYIQDETGGLTIRQTSGDFFDDVADGTIVPGSTLSITGTLSEFASLLQINGGDLSDYSVTGTADIPEPQNVSLATLSTDGEDFEGELIRVIGITIDGAGTFEERTTYQITDGSGANGAVTLRVPNADDTTVDGEPIPANRVDVIAIAGQFDFNDPTVGYQLLVLDIADITDSQLGVDTGADPETGLALRVANPVRSLATVTFSVAEAGPALVELYDALGRRVAVLADGAIAAGAQTTTLDAGSLAPGVYVLRLQAGTEAIARTLTVVR
ncbi:MAG: Ig-like domain-containing protein, partial [Bacteroidota bacterium]